MQPQKSHFQPCSSKNLQLYEHKLIFDIFFIDLSLREGYYWVSLKIHFGKAFESCTSTLYREQIGFGQCHLSSHYF
jgi:hypothetical protein